MVTCILSSQLQLAMFSGLFCMAGACGERFDCVQHWLLMTSPGQLACERFDIDDLKLYVL